MNLNRLRRFLKQGGVVAYATESCFGLGCDPTNARAVQRILTLKGRPRQKGLILIGSEVAQFRRYLAPLPENLDLSAWWPGPVSVLLPRAKHCPRWLTGHHTKLAVRVTAHTSASQLCHQLGMALVSTSANLAGHISLKTAAACRRQFGAQVLVLDGTIGQRKRPSTLIDPEHGSILRS